jgi:hypothetical protein
MINTKNIHFNQKNTSFHRFVSFFTKKYEIFKKLGIVNNWENKLLFKKKIWK